MKKLALLLVLTFTLSLSCAFATDEEPLLISPNPMATSGETLSGENGNTTLPVEEVSDLSSTEDKSGEIVEPTTSGETLTDDTTSAPADSTDTIDNEETKSNNSSLIGAIIAIAIVIAVVVVAAIIRKD